MEPGSVNSESEHVQSYIIDQSTQVSPQSADWTANIHSLQFIHNGKYISGHVDSSQDLVQLLENYRSITGTAFSSSQNLVQVMKNMDEGTLQMRFSSPASRPRLFWQMNAGEPTIRYDGVPFMSVGHGTDLPCIRYGGRRKKVEQVSLPSGEMIPVDYRMKTGCEAKITIRRILRFPCAEYNSAMANGIAAVRRQRKQILDDLILRIGQGSVKFQEQYHLLLPTPMAHNGHVIADIDGPPPIVQHVLDEIIAQLSNGVTTVSVLHERIKNFVITTSSNLSLYANDPMYCPSDFDIFRQVYWLYKLGQVVDRADSHFKNSINMIGQSPQSQSVASVVSNPSTPPINSASSSDAITSVYSIVMDTPDGGGGLDQLDHQISSEQEVELNSGDGSAHLIGDESSLGGQMRVGGANTSPISQSSAMQSSGHIGLSAKRSLMQGKVSSKRSVHSHSNSYRTDEDHEDNPISQAQTEVQSMLKIIENQTHACKNMSALNNLRRQLTELCGQFSVYLAGGQSADFVTPPTKRSRT